MRVRRATDGRIAPSILPLTLLALNAGSGELDALSDALQESCTNYNFDPYHGVEFSKDRKETIVDTVEKPKTVHMQGRAEPQDKLKQMACTEITAGQWMSGVPIGSEQSVSGLGAAGVRETS